LEKVLRLQTSISSMYDDIIWCIFYVSVICVIFATNVAVILLYQYCCDMCLSHP